MRPTLVRAASFCLLAGNAAAALAIQTPFEATVSGAKCAPASNGVLSCHYKIGTGLELSIAAIGQIDTGIGFMNSNIDADYYARFGVQHGCVIVMYGKKGMERAKTMDFAFISPRTGRVYKDWQECKGG